MYHKIRGCNFSLLLKAYHKLDIFLQSVRNINTHGRSSDLQPIVAWVHIEILLKALNLSVYLFFKCIRRLLSCHNNYHCYESYNNYCDEDMDEVAEDCVKAKVNAPWLVLCPLAVHDTRSLVILVPHVERLHFIINLIF